MLQNTLQWILRDFRSHPVRFTAESLGWLVTVSCALTMALTLPSPPFHITYPLWICASTTFAATAWTRGSFWMVANYMILVSIDLIALGRLWNS